MDRDEILAMEAGENLDELIVIHVMKMEAIERGILIGWSSDIAKAWLIIEKLDKEGHQINIYNFGFETWTCEIDKNYHVEGKTAPLAICRAVLLAALEL